MQAASNPRWTALLEERDALIGLPLSSLFATDPRRFDRLSRRADGLLLDLSKQRVTPEIVEHLCAYAEHAGFARAREQLFDAAIVNASENRPALHWALRAGAGATASVGAATRAATTAAGSAAAGGTVRVLVNNTDVMPDIRRVRDRMREIAEAIGEGSWLGATGKPIDQVLHLGIGGSDLGPRMAVHALAEDARPGVDVRFVSNVDPAQLGRLLPRLGPERTLLIVCSKSFRTQETLANADAARRWLAEGLGANADLSRHVIAVSSNVSAAREFGIAETNILPMWDWVGGRFSLWSAVGLPLAIAIGWDKFDAMLEGGASIDRHFRETPARDNLPLLLALIDLWNVNALHITQRMQAPYASALDLFPLFIQQLEMESNGKGTRADGTPVEWTTSGSVWGAAGTDSQHSFFQWLHQGNVACNAEFIVPVSSRHGNAQHGDAHRQTILLANAIAQSQALLTGRTREDVEAEMKAQGVDPKTIAQVAPQRTFTGNRPSTTLLVPQLDARTLGQLVALFEHKTYCYGFLTGINSFDQWGVELGKTLAVGIEKALTVGSLPGDTDGSTAGLVAAIRSLRDPPH